MSTIADAFDDCLRRADLPAALPGRLFTGAA